MGKVNWKFQDELGLDLNRYKSIDQTTGEEKDIKLIRNAQLSQTGTLLNAENLNALIDAINSNADYIKGNADDIADLQDYTDEINNKVSTNTTDISNLKKAIDTNTTNTSNKTPFISFTSSTTANSTIDRVKRFMEELVDECSGVLDSGEVFTCKIKVKNYAPYCFLASVLEVQEATQEVAMLDLQTLDYYWGTVMQLTTQDDFYTKSLTPKTPKKLYSHNIKLYDSTNTKTTIFITLQNEYSGTINASNITDYLDLNKYIQANGNFRNTAGTVKNVYALQIYKNTSNAYRYMFQCFDSTEEIGITSLICSDSVQLIGEF